MVWRTTMRSSSAAPLYRDGDPRIGPTTDFQTTWRHPESVRRVEDRITPPPPCARPISKLIQFAADRDGRRQAVLFDAKTRCVHAVAASGEKGFARTRSAARRGRPRLQSAA